MPDQTTGSQNPISTYNESPLHADLKQWYARPGDRLEVAVAGYIIDIVRGDLLVEVQTGSFSSIKGKLIDLTATHPVRLVYPIAREKWLVKLAKEGQGRPRRRKSPKHGGFEDIFDELVRFPQLVARENLTLDVLLIQEEEVRRHEPGRAWRRRGWVTVERRLLEVVDQRAFTGPADLATLLPADLPTPFTTADLAEALGRRRRLAQRMAYCLRKIDAITIVGKEGNALLYQREEN